MILPISADKLLVAHRGQLITVDLSGMIDRVYKISSSSLVRMVEGSKGYFAVKHHDFAEPSVRSVTAHHVSDPAQPLARLEIENWEVLGSGDPSVWADLPVLFNLVYPYVLQLTEDAAKIVRLPGIPGHPDDPLDPYRLVPCPDGQSAIMTLTRGGRFVIYDVETGEIRANLQLGKGNPIFRFRNGAPEMWLAQTDTIFKIDTTTWTIARAARIRNTLRGRQISEMQFDATGERLAVAFSERRPAPLMQPYRLAPVQGMVVVLDPETMEAHTGAPSERWVDELAFIDNGNIALRERGSDLFITVADLEPVDFPTYPPRPPDQEWY